MRSSPGPAAAGHYDHIFVIVEENHGYADVIGHPACGFTPFNPSLWVEKPTWART